MLSLQCALLGVLLLALAPVDAFWRMTCGRIQTGRIDPIITPGGIAGHCHLISGPINFNTTSTFDSMQASYCTSCGIQADKSAYWTPQLYYRFKNGTFVDVPTGGTVVYYLSRGDGMDSMVAFPPGFRVLSGDAAVRSYDNTTLTYGGNATKKYQNRPIADRTSFACLNYDNPQPETPGFSNLNCPGGLRAQIHFQNCWDGVNLYKSDQSHAAYMSGIDTGVCPPTHPVYIPHLFYEVIYSVNNIGQENGGYFVFSNGDTTGYGFHGDFLNGWDMNVLNAGIKQCMGSNATNGGGINTCPPLNASLDPFMDKNCPEQPNLISEQTKGYMRTLPGCNPPTGGPLRAAQNICPVQPNLNPVQNTDGIIRIRDAPGDKHGDFQYLGCAFDAGTPKTLQGGFYQDGASMTLESCYSYCRTNGYRYSGVENGYQCYCGNAFLNTIRDAGVCSQQSAIVCNGNSLEYCGGQNIVYLYNDTQSSVIVKGLPIPGQSNLNVPSGGTATYGGCFPEPNGGRALSGTAGTTVSFSNATGMTNELCTQFCKAAGYSLAGTEYASECYCGNVITTAAIGQGNCSLVCRGDNTEFCGAGGKLSVWSLSSDGSVSVSAPATSSTASATGSATGSATPVPSATGITYIGCVSEATNGRALKAFFQDLGSSGTIDACAALAQAANYRYFGMEYTSQCSYGDVLDATSTTLDGSKCTLKCKGNAAQTCGGSSAISLYNNTAYTPRILPVVQVPNQQTAQYLYKGCYAEPSGGRALGATSGANGGAYTLDVSTNSLETCAALCYSKGYSWMGTEYGSQCYCNNNGIVNGAVLSSGGDNDCSMACKGNSTENCGNSGKLQAYQLKTGSSRMVKRGRM